MIPKPVKRKPITYPYRPLPDGLVIKESPIEGLGLFTEEDLDAGVRDGRSVSEDRNSVLIIFRTLCMIRHRNRNMCG